LNLMERKFCGWPPVGLQCAVTATDMRYLAAVGAGTGQMAAPAVGERCIASLNRPDYLFGSPSGSFLGIKRPEHDVTYALAAIIIIIIIIIIIFNYALQPSRLIVRSGLDVPTFATRRLYACHHARAPSGGRWNCGREMSGNFA